MTNRSLISLVVLASLSALGVLTTPQPVGAAEEQAVIATIKLRSGNMGTAEERDRISALENQLSDAIKNSSAGEFDGDEYGNGTCTLYMYGPSAEHIHDHFADSEKVPSSPRFICGEALWEAGGERRSCRVKWSLG